MLSRFTHVRPRIQRAPLRPGFTLVELLVVFGIIVVLLSIILPMVQNIRNAARRTICTSRIKDLVVATINYRVDNGVFPDPMLNPSVWSDVYPHDLQSKVLNEYFGYLKFQRIDGKAPAPNTTNYVNFPEPFRCPMVDVNWPGQGPFYNGPEYWNVGYAYFYGLDVSAKSAFILQPSKVATVHPNNVPATAVLWADDISHYSDGSQDVYIYTHLRKGVIPDKNYEIFHSDAKALGGGNFGHADGSVEWVDGLKFDLNPANINKTASYNIQMGAGYCWWF